MIVKKAVAATLIFCGVGSVVILFVGLRYGSSGASQTVAPGSNPLAGITNNNNGLSTETPTSSGTTTVVNPDGSVTTIQDTSSGNNGSASTGSNSSTPSTTTTKPSTSGTSSINSFSASPASISYGASSTLSWSTSNVPSCSISPSLGAVATNGSKSTGNLTSTTTFTFSCGTIAKQTTVTVGAAPLACGQSGGACSSAQVASHNTNSNCWVTYNGYYYIITSYIPQHPGGQSVFSGACGHDISAYMNGSAGSRRHSHSSGAYNTLNSYRVGPVQG